MAGSKRKYKITLTNDVRNLLKEIKRSKKISKTINKRCEILLALDLSQNTQATYEDCAYYLGVSVPTISRLVKMYTMNGLDSVLILNRNTNSDNVNRKIDGVLEARTIAMACSPLPEGLLVYSTQAGCRICCLYGRCAGSV